MLKLLLMPNLLDKHRLTEMPKLLLMQNLIDKHSIIERFKLLMKLLDKHRML